MKTIDDLVTIRPTEIQSLRDVEVVLEQISNYSKGGEVGVVLRQNLQLGGTYLVRTRTEYEAYLPQEGRKEFYCQFWPRSYFEGLREQYK